MQTITQNNLAVAKKSAQMVIPFLNEALATITPNILELQNLLQQKALYQATILTKFQYQLKRLSSYLGIIFKTMIFVIKQPKKFKTFLNHLSTINQVLTTPIYDTDPTQDAAASLVVQAIINTDGIGETMQKISTILQPALNITNDLSLISNPSLLSSLYNDSAKLTPLLSILKNPTQIQQILKLMGQTENAIPAAAVAPLNNSTKLAMPRINPAISPSAIIAKSPEIINKITQNQSYDAIVKQNADVQNLQQIVHNYFSSLHLADTIKSSDILTLLSNPDDISELLDLATLAQEKSPIEAMQKFAQILQSDSNLSRNITNIVSNLKITPQIFSNIQNQAPLAQNIVDLNGQRNQIQLHITHLDNKIKAKNASIQDKIDHQKLSAELQHIDAVSAKLGMAAITAPIICTLNEFIANSKDVLNRNTNAFASLFNIVTSTVSNNLKEIALITTKALDQQQDIETQFDAIDFLQQNVLPHINFYTAAETLTDVLQNLSNIADSPYSQKTLGKDLADTIKSFFQGDNANDISNALLKLTQATLNEFAPDIKRIMHTGAFDISKEEKFLQKISKFLDDNNEHISEFMVVNEANINLLIHNMTQKMHEDGIINNDTRNFLQNISVPKLLSNAKHIFTQLYSKDFNAWRGGKFIVESYSDTSKYISEVKNQVTDTLSTGFDKLKRAAFYAFTFGDTQQSEISSSEKLERFDDLEEYEIIQAADSTIVGNTQLSDAKIDDAVQHSEKSSQQQQQQNSPIDTQTLSAAPALSIDASIAPLLKIEWLLLKLFGKNELEKIAQEALVFAQVKPMDYSILKVHPDQHFSTNAQSDGIKQNYSDLNRTLLIQGISDMQNDITIDKMQAEINVKQSKILKF